MIEIKTALRGYHGRQSIGLFPFLIPSPQKILYFFFGCRADGRLVLIVRFAAVWATVGQRFRLKAVMADIAKIVVHSVCTSLSYGNLYVIRIFFNPKVVLNTSDALTGKIGNVVEGNDDRQLFLNAHSFSITVLHDF